MLSEPDRQRFQCDGLFVVPGLLRPEEVEALQRTARSDRALREHAFDKADGEGGEVRLSLWNHPGEGLPGRIARSRRIVDTMEQLLGDEVYHYHSKMIQKEPRVGGAWTWHQDYGYWYENGLLFPDLASVMIAVDEATEENGCLEVLVGSHRLGRIEHLTQGEQAGAEPRRVEAATKVLEHRPLPLSPGDAVFFHCNLLHRSGPNRSPHPRWALICCYNARHNEPYLEHHHPGYTPLRKVEDADVLGDAAGESESEDGRVWMDPDRDRTHTWEDAED